MSADFEQVMAQCSRGCFTGLLRVRTREGNGEVRFLSGIQDGVRFDSMEGDAALERLATASEPEFEAISSLPPIDFSSSEPVPPEGGLDRYHAAQLMRYCESNSLTCALELEVKGRVLTARYRLGELLSVEPDSEHTARLAEAKEGIYRFRLPRFELPANVQQRRSVPAAAPKAAPAPKPAAAPVAAKPAPVAASNPGVAKPAPAPAAKPAPAINAGVINPSVAKPAPMPTRPASAPAPTAASLAETPVVALKQVAIVTPVAGPVGTKAPRTPGDRPGSEAPAKAPASPPPAAPKVAASGAARPASDVRPSPARGPAPAVPPLGSAPAPRREATLIGPSVAPPQPGRLPAQPAAHAHAPAAAHAHASGAAAAAGAMSAGAGPRAAAPRSPIPSAPPSVPPSQAKPAPLQGLWADAVKPPPQSAPVELESSLRAGAAGAQNSSAAQKGLGRIEGLSSIAYTPETPPTPARAAPRSSAGYWALAIAVLIALAAAGWFTFAR
jgi:hypothetical protein